MTYDEDDDSLAWLLADRLAERDAAIEARVREQVAQDIEAARPDDVYPSRQLMDERRAMNTAARIARDGGTT